MSPRAAALLAALLLPAGALAQAPRRASSPLKASAAKPAAITNFRISFELRSHALQGSGNFVIADGSQSNYVVGGEDPDEVSDARGGKGVEYKKSGVIVNCLPVSRPDADLVDLQCQFELSGALPPVGALKARPLENFQYQTEVLIKRGQTLVLVDEPDRRVQIRLDALAPR